MNITCPQCQNPYAVPDHLTPYLSSDRPKICPSCAARKYASRDALAIQFGWLTYLLMAAFGAVLFIALAMFSMFGLDYSTWAGGLICCAVPLLLAGIATSNLWADHEQILTLGWTSLIYGVLSGLCVLLLLVATPFLPDGPAPLPTAGKVTEEEKTRYEKEKKAHGIRIAGHTTGMVGFAVLMIVTGSIGVGILKHATWSSTSNQGQNATAKS